MNNLAPIPVSHYERDKAGSARFVVTNTNTIMATQFAPIRWVVPDYLPEGLSILAGRQKLGKTWLALDWAIAVATGGAAMGSVFCEVGDVLYIDLENGHRRIQGRINMLFPGERNRPDLGRLGWVNDAPDLNKGFLPALDDWRSSVIEPRLVVIDVLQRIKPAGKAGQNSYESDYDAMSALQRWATERRVAVLCLHHTRKGGADDPLEALSGSNGLSACADTTLLLDRDGNGTTLYVRGRDVEEKESAMSFLSGMWNLIGEAAEIRRTDERSRILSALLAADAPISPREIAIATAMPRNNVDQLLFKMGKAGEVRKAGRGGYVHPDRTDLIKADDKIDKKIRTSTAEATG
ncbi:AAA family ATPase [Mesorhizobium sp. YM1C-6-2]|uniref:AAA family ATPase n=1 Tax=Mesorhizobium sp. YM1C-6-2 TaxID=1827501 RepID=UPI000EF1C170|nr:AAA family ATPase [Mesorhizobium sp. YM1C-6-2]RLP22752.1 recombinase A [Mesorhizobium sp. YM1C-6-2]